MHDQKKGGLGRVVCQWSVAWCSDAGKWKSREWGNSKERRDLAGKKEQSTKFMSFPPMGQGWNSVSNKLTTLKFHCLEQTLNAHL